MDGDVILGYLAALALLGLFVCLPISDIRRAGSLSAWLRECGRDVIASAASVLIWAGSCMFLLWMLTDGAVPVKMALLAPAGFAVMVLNGKLRRAGAKRADR